MRWENWSWALALGQIGKNLWIRRLGLMNPSASSERASEWVRCQCQLQTLWSQETRSVHFSSFASFSSFSSLGFFSSFFSASQNDQQIYLIYVRLLAIIPLWVWLSDPQSSDSMGIHGRNRSQKPPFCCRNHHVIEAWMENLCGKCPKSLGKKTIASINSMWISLMVIFKHHVPKPSCIPKQTKWTIQLWLVLTPHILAYIGFVWKQGAQTNPIE